MKIERLKAFFNPPISTIELVNRFLIHEEISKPKSKKFGHRPSSLNSPCLRKIYYSYFRVEEGNFSPEKARIFKTGIYIEKMVMEWFKGANIHIPYRDASGQVPIEHGEADPQFVVSSPRWRIAKGKLDNVAYLNEKLWIFEIKSKKASSFNKLTRPDEEHIFQTALYFQMFNDLYMAGAFSHIPEIKGKAEGIRVIYVNKDNSELKEFVLDKNFLNSIIPNIDKKILAINQYIDKKILPPKTFHYCPTCPFKDKCDKNMNIR